MYKQNEGSFGFAKRWHLCRAKTNVPECAVGFFFLYAAKNTFLILSSVCLFTMNANLFIPAVKLRLFVKNEWISEVLLRDILYPNLFKFYKVSKGEIIFLKLLSDT